MITRKLLSAKADVNRQVMVLPHDDIKLVPMGTTMSPLALASVMGSRPLVQVLIDAKADLSKQTRVAADPAAGLPAGSFTAVGFSIWAHGRGVNRMARLRSGVTELLIENGANITSDDLEIWERSKDEWAEL